MRRLSFSEFCSVLPIIKNIKPQPLGDFVSSINDFFSKNSAAISGSAEVDAMFEKYLVFTRILSFINSGKKIYKFSHSLTSELMRLDFDKVPLSLLPKTQETVCIEMADDTCFFVGDMQSIEGPPRNGVVVDSFYATVVNKNLENYKDSRFQNLQGAIACLDILYLAHEGADRTKALAVHHAIPIFNDDITFADLVKNSSCLPSNKDGETMARFIFNSIIYINSGEPDLRLFKHRKPPATNKKKRLRLFEKNNPEHDVIMVGLDFMKPKQYAVGSTMVKLHTRWQPYGPGLSKVKLIWIEPHERHFKNRAPVLTGGIIDE